MATMMTSRADIAAGKGAPAPAAPERSAPAAAPQGETAPEKSGGWKSMLPLLVNLIATPALAFAVTQFVLVPKLAGKNNAQAAAAPEPSAAGEHAGAAAPAAAPASGSRAKIAVPLSKKVLVNVAGTMGTRYLLAEFTLVGADPSLKAAVEKSDAELRDAAASALSGKTINDLEKPGIRNLVRAELISIFNSILGKGSISEIYLTEFAIQ